MRYFLTFLFFVFSSNVYAADPDSLPDVPECKIPFIKFGIYRPGDPKYGKISIVDFDDVIVTKVR